jgi:hypothetical protein
LDLEEPALFRLFAALEANSRDELLRFANRFGLLGSRNSFHATRAPADLLTTDAKKFILEAQGAWALHIHHLHEAVFLLDCIVQGSDEPLRDLYRWETKSRDRWLNKKFEPYVRTAYDPLPPPAAGTGWVARSPHRIDSPTWQVATAFLYCFAGSEFGSERRKKFEHIPVDYPNATASDPPLVVARADLDRRISNALSQWARLTFGCDGDTRRRALGAAPSNLVGLMWLQLARAYADEKKFRECKVCRWPFEVLTSHRRVKEYCDPKCKLVDYRRRLKGEAEASAAAKPPTPPK